MAYILSENKANKIIKNIRARIIDYFKENEISYAVFGKSEGLDSSVIAGLLSGIEEIKPIGVIMPCESDPNAERIGGLVLDHFKIPRIRVDLTREFHSIMGLFYSADGIYDQLANILKDCGDLNILKRLQY